MNNQDNKEAKNQCYSVPGNTSIGNAYIDSKNHKYVITCSIKSCASSLGNTTNGNAYISALNSNYIISCYETIGCSSILGNSFEGFAYITASKYANIICCSNHHFYNSNSDDDNYNIINATIKLNSHQKSYNTTKTEYNGEEKEEEEEEDISESHFITKYGSCHSIQGSTLEGHGYINGKDKNPKTGKYHQIIVCTKENGCVAEEGNTSNGHGYINANNVKLIDKKLEEEKNEKKSEALGKRQNYHHHLHLLNQDIVRENFEYLKVITCTKNEGCLLSINENECIKCNIGYCLDVSNGKCEENDMIWEENKKIYFRCNYTNEEGTMCAECIDGLTVDDHGFCVDNINCIF